MYIFTVCRFSTTVFLYKCAILCLNVSKCDLFTLKRLNLIQKHCAKEVSTLHREELGIAPPLSWTLFNWIQPYRLSGQVLRYITCAIMLNICIPLYTLICDFLFTMGIGCMIIVLYRLCALLYGFIWSLLYSMWVMGEAVLLLSGITFKLYFISWYQ